MTISKRELYDFSSYPVIQKAMRDYMTFGSILDFDEFIDSVDALTKELEKIRGKECQNGFNMST